MNSVLTFILCQVNYDQSCLIGHDIVQTIWPYNPGNKKTSSFKLAKEPSDLEQKCVAYRNEEPALINDLLSERPVG